ncbi:MAG TPA: hypothetical protein VFL91_14920 [Thermomicrobiales bacterium]|nr:hypothetical protein [Thermomicrobiales bacterium]
MTAASDKPRGAHLVGSVPLADAEEVFRTVSTILGGHLRRIPDGETGVRTNWIGWQVRAMADNPALEPEASPDAYSALRRFRLRAGADPAAITFGPLGYADAARASCATFARLKDDGTIPARCRFMVSLPTPLAPVSAFVALEAQAAVEPAYERRLLAELGEICAAIPHDQLAVQWDVAVEFALLEGVRPAPFADVRGGVVERLVRLGGRVPRDVELGYHLCYGDAGHQHFKQPEDTAKLVDIANAVSAGVARPIQWIHLPVPRGRDDDAYFAPLRDLRLHPETELYLGLVHYTDGAEGTRRRVVAAQRTLTDFGVATECGMGRRSAETIPALLRIHREVADTVA